MHLLRLTLFFMCLFALPLKVHAESPQVQPTLHRGLNLSSWLANAPRQPLYARDFAAIKNAGFDHVRLPFNPEYYGYHLSETSDEIAQTDFLPLDRAISMAEAAHLPVILDLHPSGEFIDTLERHAWAEKEFIALWQAIAERYQNQPSQYIVFELLNEPQYYKSEALWTKLAARTVAAIQRISPDRLIIIGAPHGSEIDGLPYLETSTDPHLIYSFHFYEPYMVTHQGIHMGFEKLMLRYFRMVPYPSALATDKPETYAPKATDASQAAKELNEYKDAHWDATHIAQRIDIAGAWAAQHHVRLLCGEFGVLRNHIDINARYHWIGDTRAALDKDGIGWELWDYTDLFGIAPPVGLTNYDPVDGSQRLVDPENGSRRFEPQAFPALGLRAPVQ